MTTHSHFRHCLVTLLAAAALTPAQALEANWSGFSTLGWAQSDSVYNNQRFIDRDGGFKRDSLVAGQLDLKLSAQWSATVQVKAAACEDRDSGLCLGAAWAFAAWRPDNDWLVRAGKMRLPLYLYSESLDVGVSTDMVRLPHEMYSVTPSNDFKGISLARNLGWDGRDLTLDGYVGQMEPAIRLWLRDGVAPFVPAGEQYRSVRGKLGGLVLTLREREYTARLGMHYTSARFVSGRAFPVRYPFVDIGPGLGYWKVDPSLPGPDIETIDRVRNQVVTAGGEWQFAPGWRVAGEYVRMRQKDTELGSDSRAGYIALFKQINDFTPYVSVARQRSSDGVLDWHERLVGNTLPAFIPGAAQINAAQRAAGESGYAFDQRSVALGVSYALSPTSKLKGEWMRTAVGSASGHFDAPPGQPDVQGLKVNTLSVAFSVAF